MRKAVAIGLAATLSTLFQAPAATAAEVGLLLGVDPTVFRVRLDRVNFADPLTTPMVDQMVFADSVLPGNVTGLRMTVSMTVDPGIRIYDFACPPVYDAQSLITVYAGAMPWSSQVYSGVLVWEQGDCDLVRTGLWDPAQGFKWSR